MTRMEHHRDVDRAELSISSIVVGNEGIELILRVEDWLVACGKGGNDVAVCTILNV